MRERSDRDVRHLLSGCKQIAISLYFFKEGQAFMSAIILGVSGYMQGFSCVAYALCRLILPVPTLRVKTGCVEPGVELELRGP
jgi:hypothetical protein